MQQDQALWWSAGLRAPALDLSLDLAGRRVRARSGDEQDQVRLPNAPMRPRRPRDVGLVDDEPMFDLLIVQPPDQIEGARILVRRL